VELKGSVLLTDPNLSCPCLKVEGDLFVDFTSGVGRREYLDANLRCPGEAGLGICLLAATNTVSYVETLGNFCHTVAAGLLTS
jgi:hypothetical protein